MSDSHDSSVLIFAPKHTWWIICCIHSSWAYSKAKENSNTPWKNKIHGRATLRGHYVKSCHKYTGYLRDYDVQCFDERAANMHYVDSNFAVFSV